MNSAAKRYWQRSDIKEKKKLEQRDKYKTDEGQAYEHERRRTPKSRWMRSKSNARARKKTFLLSLEEYTTLISNPCQYCGGDISQETGSGLDRINNDIGYESGNCNPCCKDCNRRRHRSMDADTFEKQSDLNNYRKKDRQIE